MPKPIIIDPAAVWEDGQLRLALGLTSSLLSRERREGRLRFKRAGNQILYLGQWILDWLDASPTAQREVAHA